MDSSKKLFLLTMVVNVIRVRNQVPDQTRIRAIVAAEDESEARRKFNPMAAELGSTCEIEPIESIDSMTDLTEMTRRICKSRGFELVASAMPAVPNCS